MAEKDKARESRRHKRARSIMKIVYKYADILDYPGSPEELRKERYAQSVDISVSGMQFLADEPIPLGHVLRLDIELPDEEIPLTTFGRVEWCKKDENFRDIYRVGLNFMLIDADHTNLIRRITGESVR